MISNEGIYLLYIIFSFFEKIKLEFADKLYYEENFDMNELKKERKQLEEFTQEEILDRFKLN